MAKTNTKDKITVPCNDLNLSVMYAGENALKLKPILLENQHKYLPVFQQQTGDANKRGMNGLHVIYNNVLYCLYEGSEVRVTKLTFGDIEERYLDDSTPECLYNAIVTVVDSILVINNEGIAGTNLIEHSSIRSQDTMVLRDSTVRNCSLNGDVVLLTETKLIDSHLASTKICISQSFLFDCGIFTNDKITVNASPNLYHVAIGYRHNKEDRDNHLDSAYIKVPSFLSGSDNKMNMAFPPTGDGREKALVIGQRHDFAPIVASNGDVFPTARTTTDGIFIKGKHIDKNNYNELYPRDIASLLFPNLPKDKSFNQVEGLIFDDFVSAIESRMKVFTYLPRVE